MILGPSLHIIAGHAIDPDKGNRKAKLRLDISDHSQGGVIVPGKVSESELIDMEESYPVIEMRLPSKNHRKNYPKKEKMSRSMD